MERAKLFKNGQSQAVRLPKALRFKGTEVYATRLGSAVVLIPADDPWRSLRESLDLFTDDYLERREQPRAEERESL
jgi:antitoxin VapB